MESTSGDFPGFRRFGVEASSSGAKGPQILFPSDVGTFHRLDICLLVSLVDSLLPVLSVPFFTSCEAVELA